MPKLLEFSRWRKVCKACASHGEAEDHFKFFQTLFLQDCILCEESFCSDHAGPFAFPAGALPEGSRTTVCSTCLPQAEHIVEDHKDCVRQTREVRASVFRLRARRVGCHDESKAENAKNCIECDAAATGSCEVCGLKLCTSHISLEPPDAPQARRLRVCSSCRGYAAARVAACEAVRKAKAQSFRAAVAGAVPRLVVATLEEAEDCASCGLVFSKLPGSLRHHCRACGRSLCAVCLCGVANCLVNAARCPHSARLHGSKEERVCAECLPAVLARLEARKLFASVAETASKYADHCLRVETFLQDPEQLPLYEANHVDTVQDKLLRAGGFAVEGAKRAAPLLSLPWALGVRAMDVVWNYGQYGLLGILMREEIMSGIKTLLSLSSTLQDIPPRDLLVGILYLSAEQRKTLRDSPDGFKRLAQEHGKPLPAQLLEALLGMACIGTFAPYHETAFEVQRFALQQNWRLVSERLGDSRKHRPAWALFLQHFQRLAAVSIRGTHVEQSRGGDLFTDFDAELKEIYGAKVHSGVLLAALALERELRPTLKRLAQAGYRIILTGHSLGGAVAAVLLWLLRHGTCGERLEAEVQGIGYAVPSVVDHRTSEALRPCFTSVVNSMDAVPRLSSSTLSRLAEELSTCAEQSKEDLDEDLAHYVERLSNVWAPRVRDGTPAPHVPAPLATPHAEDEHRELWRSHSEDEVDLYIPGSVVWIYRVRGHLEASLVPCTLPPLRRLLLDKRMFDDHSAKAIHQALLAVRSVAAGPSWQKFSEAGEKCPCCGSRYEWMNTARSGKMRCHAMTNCRLCGLVVCVACASSRRALQQGIEGRICDRCAWRGDASELQQLFGLHPAS